MLGEGGDLRFPLHVGDDLSAEAVKGPDFDVLKIGRQPFLDLIGRFPVERKNENLPRRDALVPHKVGNFAGDYRGLSGAGAGKDLRDVLIRGDGGSLLVGWRVADDTVSRLKHLRLGGRYEPRDGGLPGRLEGPLLRSDVVEDLQCRR